MADVGGAEVAEFAVVAEVAEVAEVVAAVICSVVEFPVVAVEVVDAVIVGVVVVVFVIIEEDAVLKDVGPCEVDGSRSMCPAVDFDAVDSLDVFEVVCLPFATVA